MITDSHPNILCPDFPVSRFYFTAEKAIMSASGEEEPMAVDPTYGGVRQPILAVFFFLFFPGRIRLKTAASLVFMWRSVGLPWRDGEPRNHVRMRVSTQ